MWVCTSVCVHSSVCVYIVCVCMCVCAWGCVHTGICTGGCAQQCAHSGCVHRWGCVGARGCVCMAVCVQPCMCRRTLACMCFHGCARVAVCNSWGARSHVHMRVWVHMCVWEHVHVCARVHACVCAQACQRACAFVQVPVCTCVCTCERVSVCTHVHAAPATRPGICRFSLVPLPFAPGGSRPLTAEAARGPEVTNGTAATSSAGKHHHKSCKCFFFALIFFSKAIAHPPLQLGAGTTLGPGAVPSPTRHQGARTHPKALPSSTLHTWPPFPPHRRGLGGEGEAPVCTTGYPKPQPTFPSPIPRSQLASQFPADLTVSAYLVLPAPLPYFWGPPSPQTSSPRPHSQQQQGGRSVVTLLTPNTHPGHEMHLTRHHPTHAPKPTRG